MKAELLNKALEADPTLRETWEKAVQTMYKTELEKIDSIRKRGSGTYVNITIQAGWEGFVSGYLLAMECIRIESESVEENLAVFDAFDSPFDLILKTGEVFKFVRYQGGKLVYRSEDGATAYPTRREKTLLRAAIEGGATVVLAGGE